MTSFGDFQEDVGKVSSTIQLVFAILFSFIFIVIGIIMIISAYNGNSKDDENIDENVKKSKITVGIIFIVLAIIMISISLLWNHLTHTNRTAAQIAGTMTEINIAKNMLGRK